MTQIIKIGFWSGTILNLWNRFTTPYGKDMIMKTFKCSSIEQEKTTHNDLKLYSYCGELYHVKYQLQLEDYCSKKFGTYEIYDKKRKLPPFSPP